MTLEEFLDHHMDKDVHDLIIVDEHGNAIISDLPGKAYQMVEIINASYIKIARLKIKKEGPLETKFAHSPLKLVKSIYSIRINENFLFNSFPC